jgi:4-amino-4-deoxy-L-arabinose transferase-like glycosyltransferase
LITPDLGATSLGTLAAYLFWRWLQAPDSTRALVTGLALGLAELTKTSWIILLGLWPAIWLIWYRRAT